MPEPVARKGVVDAALPASFLRAGELRERFVAFGHFYDVGLPGGAVVRCRSVLELILRAQAGASNAGARRGLPDAIFVMMNPGSSRPLNGDDAETATPWSLTKHMVTARPDSTQYQAMRVMDHMGWDHVRVINLSDIREPRSDAFMQRFQALEDEVGFSAHSIFDPTRRAELAQELQRREGAPLVLAWGVHPRLAPLTARALPWLRSQGPCIGIPWANSADRYFHPLPTLQADKVAWVRSLCGLLQQPS